MISRDWLVLIKYVGCEGNKVADLIAKWAARQEIGIFELPQPPQYLDEVLEEEENDSEMSRLEQSHLVL